MPKLTKKAQFVIILFMVLVMFGVGFLLRPKQEEKVEPKKETIVVVKENVTIKSQYIDSISKEKSSSQYTSCQMKIQKGEKISGYTITNDQTFTKYLQLKGPNGKDVLTKQSKQVITHYAYSFLLTGDIIEKTIDNQKTYEVVNARITYDIIPFALLENENKACIRNKEKTKVKIMELQEFISKLNDIKERKEILNW